jgi:hypothetical protein
MAPKIWNFYGFSTEKSFKNQMNKKMSGGETMYSPPSRMDLLYPGGRHRLLLTAPGVAGTQFGGTYPVKMLSQLTNTLHN